MQNIRVGKLKVDVNPELISAASKAKKLNVYAVWLALRTIDLNKQGTGKFTLSTCLEIIQEITKCNKNYAYEIFKKGVDCFWKPPVGNKGEKVVYLLGINKVAEIFTFEIAKTKPFVIRMEDLFSHDSQAELKTFLCDFVIGRFGQNKPITIRSLEGNLGLSKSSIKRRISNSYNLTRKKNYCFMDNKFDNVCEAHNHLRKTRIMFPNDSSSYRIIKKEGKFIIAKQLGNSYSVEDFSRGKISKRPSGFRKIDSDNKESLLGKKFFYTKIKKANDNNFVLSKIKSDNSDFYVWKLINPEQESLNEINENLQNSHRVKVWNSEKKWSKRKKEC